MGTPPQISFAHSQIRKKQNRNNKVTLSNPKFLSVMLNPLNAELNPICYLLTLLGAHHFLHVSRIRVKIPGSISLQNPVC